MEITVYLLMKRFNYSDTYYVEIGIWKNLFLTL